MQTPIVKKRKMPSPVWILPILALMIGGWLLYKSIKEAGIPIIVHFENAQGVIPNKTKVVSRGIPIGVVRKVNIDPNMEGVSLYIEINRKAEASLVKDTLFWLVRPEISAGRIRGLETLLSGSYIGVRKGTSHIPSRVFVGLMEPPPVPPNAPGLHIKLKAGRLGSIQKGSNLYFKSIPIGSVQGYKLKKDGTVLIDAYIEPEYSHLVRTSTRFWNVSGLNVSGDFSGFKLHVESLASLIYGGIALDTPRLKRKNPLAVNGEVFTLYPSFYEARFGIDMFLKLPSAKGLKPGISKVVYRGLELGTVTDLTLNNDEKHSIMAKIVIDPHGEFILREGTRFWVVNPRFSITGIEHAEALIKGPYITLKPGKGAFCNHFIAQKQPNFEEALEPGVPLKLRADNSRALSVGAPVLYRQFKVGEVTGFDLSPDGNGIVVHVIVYKRYKNLLDRNSVFFKVKSIEINASLNGIKIKTGTLSSILDGGIAFVSPDRGKRGYRFDKKHRPVFRLFECYEDAINAVPALQSRGCVFHLRSPDLKSLGTGSPVMYKKIPVGEVVGYSLPKRGRGIVIDIFVKERYLHLINNKTRFYNISGIEVEGSLTSGIRVRTGSVKSIINGGIGFISPEEGTPAREGYSFYLYGDYQSAVDSYKVTLNIQMGRNGFVKAGTKLFYRGMCLGRVKKISYDTKRDSFRATAVIERSYRGLFRRGTKIWIARPEIGISGIKHVDAVLSGPFLEVMPGRGPVSTSFELSDSPPRVEDVKEGLNIVLESPELGSLRKDSPVYYRQVRVGRVTGYDLSPKARGVWIHVNIYPRYVPLVRAGTRFWNVSGIKVDAGLFSGIRIEAESVQSIVAGGIAMSTPPRTLGKDSFSLVSSGHHFVLYKKPEKEWLTWRPAIALKK